MESIERAPSGILARNTQVRKEKKSWKPLLSLLVIRSILFPTKTRFGTIKRRVFFSLQWSFLSAGFLPCSFYKKTHFAPWNHETILPAITDNKIKTKSTSEKNIFPLSTSIHYLTACNRPWNALAGDPESRADTERGEEDRWILVMGGGSFRVLCVHPWLSAWCCLPACLPPNALIQWSGKRGSLTEKKPGRIPLCVSLSRHYQMLVLPRAHHKTSVGLLGKERENETIRTRAGKWVFSSEDEEAVSCLKGA